MALFSNDEESISEELLKKSKDASASAQEVVINGNDADSNDPDKDVYNKRGLAYLEVNGIKANDAIDILGSKDAFVSRLKDFASLAKTKYGNLMESKATMNMEKYSIDSGILKKECNYLGIEKLFIMAKTHEQKSRLGDTNYVIENFKEYEDEIMRIIKLVDEYLA